MNILPHKSWHVYNKKNIEKVRKDEAKAKKEQEAKDKRALVADSEVRLKLLRQKASKNEPVDNNVGHVHLFADAEKAALENEEVIADQKAEKDKMDKQITMYLDKGTKDEEAPWYVKKGYTKYTDDHLSKPYIKSRHDKDHQKRHQRPPITLHDDPLDLIKSHLDKDDEKKKKDRHRHHRHHHSTKSPSIEQLRAQRKEREKAEQLRTQQLIYGDTQQQQQQQQHYNSQYNRMETDQAHQSKRRRKY
ncbi:hypothetical protein BC941DRAFT_439259 [Chlamydoabsidia padenii]|nr:hypothetical protein BC941DRAFT_439259 [Chlamydoabsidia padenii]